MKKIGIIILFSLLGILFISPVFAAMNYPPIAGITISSTTTATEYIYYFFNLAIAIGAFIAAGALSIAGIAYVSSRGEPAKMQDARDKIKNTFLGLIILLACYMILNIINPQLTSIKIDQTEKVVNKEIVIPEGTGIYLYDAINYTSKNEPLRVYETMPNFVESNFNSRAKSIKLVNPDSGEFNFGAILFAQNIDTASGSGADLRGNCSFILNSIPNLNDSLDQENNPPIGNNKLVSMLVFKTKGKSPSVTVYNSIDCTKRSDDYGPQKDEENMCSISAGSGFQDITKTCPKFKGEVISIKTSGDVGVLLKTVTAAQAGRCQFIESNNDGCINTVKYSYAYKISQASYQPSFYPKSFMLFSLVK
jgi:hypothetical protein